MRRVLIAECMQEISSFNPVESGYANFAIDRGADVYRQRALNRAIGGALATFEARADVEVIPSISARASSAGILSAEGWRALSTEILAAIRERIEGVDAIYVSLHGAMGAIGELDPEGFLLQEIRAMSGPDALIVVSLDLHGVLTERMLRQIDGLAIYHTYPHVDFADTGRRAAELLLHLMDNPSIRPVITRVVIPALVRGDELITRTGCYGELIGECKRMEREGGVLAAGVMIGNPFTDVPELCSQVIAVTDGERPDIDRAATQLAEEFWSLRFRMQGKLIGMDRAIAQVRAIDGTAVFTDAADATSSGASGDSNAILRALRDAGYEKRVLAQIVDADAAAMAHEAGVGAVIDTTIGGGLDPDRFEPMPIRATVKLLSDGKFRLETMRMELDAGPTAVLCFGSVTVVVISRTVSLFDRALYFANGLNPREFDLVVVKSPHTEHRMYDAWVERNFNVDAPGATSADLRSLGHTICARPMYPLDDGFTFTPEPTHFSRGG